MSRGRIELAYQTILMPFKSKKTRWFVAYCLAWGNQVTKFTKHEWVTKLTTDNQSMKAMTAI